MNRLPKSGIGELKNPRAEHAELDFSPISTPDLGACLQANEIGDNQAMTKRYQFKLVIFVNRPVGISTRLFVVIMMQIIAVQYT